MNRQLACITFVSVTFLGCAQVPRQSVELSTTMGRDLAVVHKAHRELARAFFAHMRRDVNRFVDEVYTPYQIHNAMTRQGRLAASSDPNDRRKSLVLAISAAFASDAPTRLQADVLKAMGGMVEAIKADTEEMRQQLLRPLDAQETEILDSIERAYLQLHYANSIVTGHLASVVKVHEAQAELLDAIGVDRDLRRDVGQSLSLASDRIEGLVNGATAVDAQLTQAEETARQIRLEIMRMGEVLTGTQKEK